MEAPPPVPAALLEPEARADRATTPHDLLLAVVSERTGYPVEMLDLDLDLEAELSIDSIKRIEILGALAERAGLRRAGTRRCPRSSSAVKTLRAILDWLETIAGGELGRAAWHSVPPPRPMTCLDAPPLGRFVLELGRRGGGHAGRTAARGPRLHGRRRTASASPPS